MELAHEALLTEWERYKGWVDDARDDLLTRRRLESATRDWVNAGSDPSFLYGGGRLELAESWAAASGFELTDDERRFLADEPREGRSGPGRTYQAPPGDRRAARRRSSSWRAVMAGVALVQRRSADRQANETRAREVSGTGPTGNRGGP